MYIAMQYHAYRKVSLLISILHSITTFASPPSRIKRFGLRRRINIALIDISPSLTVTERWESLLSRTSAILSRIGNPAHPDFCPCLSHTTRTTFQGSGKWLNGLAPQHKGRCTTQKEDDEVSDGLLSSIQHSTVPHEKAWSGCIGPNLQNSCAFLCLICDINSANWYYPLSLQPEKDCKTGRKIPRRF